MSSFSTEEFLRTVSTFSQSARDKLTDPAIVVPVYAYRVPILDVENAIVALPYVVEAAVVGVPDPACANQIGAVVRLRQGVAKLSLNELRSDLSKSLPAYTLPTKLRELDNDEVLPRTVSYKTQRKQTATEFFAGSAAVERVQVCPTLQDGKDRPVKAWDWAGLQ